MESYSNVTRLLCASAILLGRSFRKTLLDHYKQRFIATAPEVGLDARLLMQVVTYIENWDEKRDQIRRNFGWLFLALAVVMVVLYLLTQDFVAPVIALFLVGGVIQFIQLTQQEKYAADKLLDHFKRRDYSEERIRDVFGETALDSDVESGLPDRNQNIVIYSGFLPFIGTGINLDGWSFATNVTYGKETALGETLTPMPFEVRELYEQVQKRLESMNLLGMQFQEMVYVNGLDVRDHEDILPDKYGRPVQLLQAAALDATMAGSDPQVRHYKWIRVHYAQDALILSFFLRFSLRGNNLFTELSRFLLTPPADAYQELDNRRKPEKERRILKLIGKVVASLLLPPLSVISGVLLPLEIVTRFISDWGERRRKRREYKEMCEEIDENPLYDWGITSSIRDLVGSQRYDRYFQKLDKDMYNKVIERTILDTIVDFLGDHNISTADLKERRTSILNNGVIVQGGNIEAQALAVGTGATATQQNQTQQPEKSRSEARGRGTES